MVNTMTTTSIDLSKRYEDGFSLFSTNEEDYIEAVKSLGANRDAETIRIKDIVFKAMPIPMEAYCSYFDDETAYSVVLDTIESGTKVYVELDGKPYMLRDTALTSIFERLRIAGDVLNDIPSEMLAAHLNNYASFATNDGLAIANNGKLEAILGMKYSLVPTEDIMCIASEYFASGEKPAKFLSGSFTHNYSDAKWKVGRCKIETPINAGFNESVFEQSVVVSTSDSGRKAVTISPQLRQVDANYGLEFCLPLKLEHDGKANLEAFEKSLKLIDKRFQDATECISQMADTELDFPVNVLLSLLKWLKIPAKYGVPVWERRKIMWDGVPRSAYDVYASLSEVLSLIVGDEPNSKALAQYQEKFSRGLKFDYRQHDLPGMYTYNDKLIGAKGV